MATRLSGRYITLVVRHYCPVNSCSWRNLKHAKVLIGVTASCVQELKSSWPLVSDEVLESVVSEPEWESTLNIPAHSVLKPRPLPLVIQPPERNSDLYLILTHIYQIKVLFITNITLNGKNKIKFIVIEMFMALFRQVVWNIYRYFIST